MAFFLAGVGGGGGGGGGLRALAVRRGWRAGYDAPTEATGRRGRRSTGSERQSARENPKNRNCCSDETRMRLEKSRTKSSAIDSKS